MLVRDRFRALSALGCAVLVGCGGDAKPRDDAGRAPDAGTRVDAAGRDAGAERDASVAVTCGEGALGERPAWLTQGATGQFSATCANRDVHLSMLADGVVRLRYAAPGSSLVERSFSLVTPAAELAPDPQVSLGRSTRTEAITVCGSALSVEVQHDGCRVQVRDAAGVVLVDDLADAAASARVLVRAAPIGTSYVGFGEKTGRLDKRGQRLVFYGTDAYETAYGGYGPTADPLYLSVPFFLGVHARGAFGVFTDVAWRSTFDMARARADAYRIETTGESVDQYILPGPSAREVVTRYTALTGRTPRPPRWALGYHQSRWGYASQARVLEVAREMQSRGLPCTAMWLDIQHMDGFRTFTFDPRNYGDPEGLVRDLAALGMRLVVIADPGLKQDPEYAVYGEAIRDAAVLEERPGTPYVGSVWAGPSVFPDFTRPSGRALWSRHVAELARRGIAGVWLDVNEPTTFPEGGAGSSVPDTLPVSGDGHPTTMAEAHNAYASLEARATREGLLGAMPDRRPFVLSRAGFAGIQRFAAVWTGDAPSTWTSLQQVMPMLLGMGLSGVPFVGSDVGGYSGHASAELFARWMALGAVSPFFRGHVTQGVPDQEPWAFGEVVTARSRDAMLRRRALTPYLESVFDDAVRTGAPVLRAMLFEAPANEALSWASVDDQAMLGPALLVAPITAEGAIERSVRLPSGRFFELASDLVFEGPAEVTLAAPPGELPILVRGGSVVPRLGDGEGVVVLDAYPPREDDLSAHASAWVDDAGEGNESDGLQRRSVTLARTADGVVLSATAAEGSYEGSARRVEVHRLDHGARAVRLDDVVLSQVGSVAALDGAVLPAYAVDSDAGQVVIAMHPTRAAWRISVDADASVDTSRVEVDVTFEVTVPSSTPASDTIYVASSARAWSHVALSVAGADHVARGTLRLPRGAWVEYKYTRGDWTTVEKLAGCLEAQNRVIAVASGRIARDEVAVWRDACP